MTSNDRMSEVRQRLFSKKEKDAQDPCVPQFISQSEHRYFT